jgi:hypothetical protein
LACAWPYPASKRLTMARTTLTVYVNREPVGRLTQDDNGQMSFPARPW